MTISKFSPGKWSYSLENGSNFELTSDNGDYIISGCGCCGSPNVGEKMKKIKLLMQV